MATSPIKPATRQRSLLDRAIIASLAATLAMTLATTGAVFAQQPPVPITTFGQS